MNYVDLVFLIIILMYGAIGFKRGFTREVVSCLGFTIVIWVSFFLKNPISAFFYQNFPFFPLSGYFKGLTTLNILIYEVFALLLVVSIGFVIFRLLLFGTKIFEKFLNMTIILGIPSKLLGMVVGFIEGIFWVFVIMYVLSLPVFKNDILKDSKLDKVITTSIPVLSKTVTGFKKVSNEITDLKDSYKDNKISADEFNYQSLDLMLKYGVIKPNSVKILKEKGKLKFKGLDTLIETYGDK